MGPSIMLDYSEALFDLQNHPFLRWGTNAMSALDGFNRAVMANGEALGMAYDKMLKLVKRSTAKHIEKPLMITTHPCLTRMVLSLMALLITCHVNQLWAWITNWLMALVVLLHTCLHWSLGCCLTGLLQTFSVHFGIEALHLRLLVTTTGL